MPAGLQVWDANGNLKIDLNTPLCRLIEEFTVGRDVSGSKNYSNINGIIFAFSLSLETSDFTKIQHTVTTSGSTVTWTPFSGTGTVSRGASRVMVFAHA